MKKGLKLYSPGPLCSTFTYRKPYLPLMCISWKETIRESINKSDWFKKGKEARKGNSQWWTYREWPPESAAPPSLSDFQLIVKLLLFCFTLTALIMLFLAAADSCFHWRKKALKVHWTTTCSAPKWQAIQSEQLAREHNGAFNSLRAWYFPQKLLKTKIRAKRGRKIGVTLAKTPK